MKRHVLCVVALLTLGAVGAAADEMTSAPALVITGPATTLHWTGFYIGGNGGFGWANSAVAYTPNDPAAQLGTCGGYRPNSRTAASQCIPGTDYYMNGPEAGGQIGFNWQLNAYWLVGAEADYQWSDLKGTASTSFRLGGASTTSMAVNESVNSFGTVRARMGVIPVSPLLLYGTGGFAYGRVSDNLNAVPSASGAIPTTGGFSYVCTAGVSCFAGSSTKTAIGWTAGAGAEFAILNNVTLRTEVLYVHLGAPTGTAVAESAAAGATPSSFTAAFPPAHFVIVRGGLNLNF